MSARKGLSLVEVIVTMALISVILGVVSSLFQYSSRAIIQTNQRANAMVSAYGAFSQVSQDLSSAIAIYSPPPGGAAATTVNVIRMSPYNTSNFSLPPLGAGSAWVLHKPALQWKVVYQFQNNILTRTVTPTTGPAWAANVADNLSSFNCTIAVDSSNIPYYANMQASVQTPTAVMPVALRVPLHIPPQVVTQ